MRRWFWSLVVVGSLASLALCWLTDWPLGVPGEWTWGRHAVTPDLAANLGLGVIVGIIYLAFVGFGLRRLARPQCRRVESAAWLLGLAVMAVGWIIVPLASSTSGASLGRWPYVLYFPASSGYFFQARNDSPDAAEFLRGYEALMREGDVLHTGTHPPGLFLFFHGLIGVAERNPDLSQAIVATQPAVVRESLDVINAGIRESNGLGDLRAAPLSVADRAVLWLAGVIAVSIAAATVWPLYGFLRMDLDRPTSWLVAAAWPLVPAIGVFLPKSDVAFAFFAMLCAWLWRRTWRHASLGLATLTAIVWTLGVLCSLAFLPVALWLALVSLFDAWPALRGGQWRQELVRGVRTILPAGVTVVAILGLLAWKGEIAIWNVYWWNYHNHAGFYHEYPRTYLAWLAVNPLELMFSAGPPLFIAAWFGIGSELRRWRTGAPSPLLSPCLTTLIVWGWLWLSGKNSGEAARLWTFLVPYFTVCAAAWWSPLTEHTSHRPALVWLLLQAAVCLLTVQRVNGFPL